MSSRQLTVTKAAASDERPATENISTFSYEIESKYICNNITSGIIGSVIEASL